MNKSNNTGLPWVLHNSQTAVATDQHQANIPLNIAVNNPVPKKTRPIQDDKNELNAIPEELKEDNYLEVGVRPWGVYYVLEDKSNYKVKKIIVNPGHRLSLQSHKHRSEHWVTVSGTATIYMKTRTDTELQEFDMPPSESCFIPMNAKHRLANYGKIPLVLIEVQVGEYTGEDDIIRYQDDYSRD